MSQVRPIRLAAFAVELLYSLADDLKFHFCNEASVTPKSGVFLAGSCIAAIAAVGSVFELSSGKPELGSLTTGIILALSIPLVVILFMAAVQDARANQK
jgi:hypothetical protein